jgi:lipoprotein-releasing system permease protein
MKHPLNIQIAFVHLSSNYKQSLVSLLSVTFGVSMYIFMNSFMNGVNQTQDDLAFSALSHIRISNESMHNAYNPMQIAYDTATTLMYISNKKSIQRTEGIKNTAKIVDLLNAQHDVSGVACQVNFSAIFRNGAKKVNGLVSGVEVENEDRLMGISEKVIAGAWGALTQSKNGIILGNQLAENMSLKTNDLMDILTPEGYSAKFVVVGIIETSLKELDKSKAYINIGTARRLLNTNCDYATDIRVNLIDRNFSQPFLQRIKPLVPYQVESWQEANQQLVAASQLRNIIAMAVSLAILLVAGFGIYNIMNMTINERIKEIAILKAMGFSGHDITLIFLQQAVCIGVVGGIAGVGLGYLISTLINQVPFKVAGLTTLPITYNLADFIMAFFFGVLTTIIAGFMPARKASRVDPILIIRG